MLTLCRHILISGKTCAQPALRESFYCRFHTQTCKHTRRRSRYGSVTVPLAFPDDRAAVQFNLHLIALATLEGRIEPPVARALTHTYRACMSNLNAGPLLTADPKTTVSRVILTPEGDEIATPRQVLEPGETLHHGPECPCAVCAEQYRQAPPEQHHPDCPCGLCHTPVPLSQASSTLEDVILSDPEQTGAPTDRSSSAGWRSEGESKDLHLQTALSHEPLGGPSRPAVGLGGEQNINVILSEATETGTPTDRSSFVRWGGCEVEGPAFKNFSPDRNPTKSPTIAPATTLHPTDFPPITTPTEPDPKAKPAPVPYKDMIREHFAKLDAEQAAREGKPAPVEKTPLELLEESNRRYEEETAQIERNRQAAEESWQRYAASEAAQGRSVEDPLANRGVSVTLPDGTVSKHFLTWNEQEDLRTAKRKKLKEEEAAHQHEEHDRMTMQCLPPAE